jgi:hypothetical protein
MKGRDTQQNGINYSMKRQYRIQYLFNFSYTRAFKSFIELALQNVTLVVLPYFTVSTSFCIRPAQSLCDNHALTTIVICLLRSRGIGDSASENRQLVEIVHDECDEGMIHSEHKWRWRRCQWCTKSVNYYGCRVKKYN